MNKLQTVFVLVNIILLTSSINCEENFPDMKCKEPIIPNGKFSLDTNYPNNTLKFDCNENFTKYEDNIYTCHNDESWDFGDKLGYCVRNGCETIERYNETNIQRKHEDIDILKLDCDGIGKTVGNSLSSCNGSNWDKPLGFCRPASSTEYCVFRNENLCKWEPGTNETDDWKFVSNHKFFKKAQLSHLTPKKSDYVAIYQATENATQIKTAQLRSTNYLPNINNAGCIHMNYLISGNATLKMLMVDENKKSYHIKTARASIQNVWEEAVWSKEKLNVSYHFVIEGILPANEESGIAIEYFDQLTDDECRQTRLLEKQETCKQIGCGKHKDFREGRMVDCSHVCQNQKLAINLTCGLDYTAKCLKKCIIGKIDNGEIKEDGEDSSKVQCNDNFHINGKPEISTLNVQCNKTVGEYEISLKQICVTDCPLKKMYRGTNLINRSHNSANYECDPELSSHGLVNITADNKCQWNEDPPICYNTTCSQIERESPSKVIELVPLAVVGIECHGSDTLVGNSKGICMNNKWVQKLGYCRKLKENTTATWCDMKGNCLWKTDVEYPGFVKTSDHFSLKENISILISPKLTINEIENNSCLQFQYRNVDGSISVYRIPSEHNVTEGISNPDNLLQIFDESTGNSSTEVTVNLNQSSFKEYVLAIQGNLTANSTSSIFIEYIDILTPTECGNKLEPIVVGAPDIVDTDIVDTDIVDTDIGDNEFNEEVCYFVYDKNNKGCEWTVDTNYSSNEPLTLNAKNKKKNVTITTASLNSFSNNVCLFSNQTVSKADNLILIISTIHSKNGSLIKEEKMSLTNGEKEFQSFSILETHSRFKVKIFYQLKENSTAELKIYNLLLKQCVDYGYTQPSSNVSTSELTTPMIICGVALLAVVISALAVFAFNRYRSKQSYTVREPQSERQSVLAKLNSNDTEF